MPTVIKASTGADLIALVPHLAGYRAVESVMLVAFRGTRTCGVLRFDLPGPAPRDQQRRIATAMIDTLCRIPAVDAVVPVVYTDAVFAGSRRPPHGDLVEALVHRAAAGGLLVRDALCRAADGWGSYLDPDLPPGGRPLAEVDESPVNAVAERQELPVRSSVVEGVELPDVPTASVARVRELLGEDGATGAPKVPAELGEPADVVGVLEFLLAYAPDPLPDALAAFAIRLLQPPPLRDLATLDWAFGPETGRRIEEQTLAHAETGSGLDPEDGVLLAGVGPRPDAERVLRAHALLARLAALSPAPYLPSLLTQLGWLSWAMGMSSRAAVFIEQALAIDPDYGLAELIAAMLAAGRLPDWAFEVPEVDEADVRYVNA